MPLSPDDLKARYDRLSFRFTPGVKAKLHRLARISEVLPTQWLEEAITFPIRLTPTARMQLEELAEHARCSPTVWLEAAIKGAFRRQIGGVAAGLPHVLEPYLSDACRFLPGVPFRERFRPFADQSGARR